MPTLHELQEKRLKIASDIRSHAEKQATWTAEDKVQWDTLNKSYDDNMAEIKAEDERRTATETVQARLKQIEDQGKSLLDGRRIGLDHQERKAADPERRMQSIDERRALALQSWMLKGKGLNDEQRAACREVGIDPLSSELDLTGLSHRQYGEPAWIHQGIPAKRELRVGLDVATSGAAKETIPAGFMYELEKKTLAFGNVRQVCRVVQTPTGNSMPWPVVDDSANEAGILSEATTISTSVDPTFSAITFVAYKLSSKPIFTSSEILQDSAFNLATELGGLIGERFGRGETTYCTTGTNSSQPQGVVTAAGTGVTSATAAAFTPDELLGLVHSLDPSYRQLPSTGFMFHDSIMLYVRKFKDGDGQYLWQPGLQVGVPDRLAGYPVSINQKMTGTTGGVPVTATKHVLFGAFEKYVIRDVGGVRLYHLTERYRDTDQDCFIAFKRFDARALNTAAFKVLLQA